MFAVGAVAQATARTVTIDSGESVESADSSPSAWALDAGRSVLGFTVLDLGVLLAAAAGLAHAISVRVHLQWWFASGVAFIAMAVAQLGLAVALFLQRTSARVVLAGIASNLVVVCVYVASRLTPLPGQPVFTGSHHGPLTAGRPFLPPAPEGVGAFDLFALVVEVVLIGLLTGLLPSRLRSRVTTGLMLVGVGMCLLGGWVMLVHHAVG